MKAGTKNAGLSRTHRAMPWFWLALAAIALVLTRDNALVFGPLILGNLALLENRFLRLSLLFAEKLDSIDREFAKPPLIFQPETEETT